MQVFTQAIDRYHPSGTLTQKAEEELIKPLLSIPLFKHPKIERRLSYYPNSQHYEKNNLICELMNLLWKTDAKGNLFKAFKDFDSFLTTIGKRAHFIHQFEVFLLGMYFIINISKKSPHIEKTCGLKTLNQIIYTWLLTATAHDFGYPVEVANEFINEVSLLYDGLDLKNHATKYRSIKNQEILKDESDLLTINVKKKDNSYELINLREMILKGIKDSMDLDMAEVIKLENKLFESSNHGYVSAVILARKVIQSLNKKYRYEDILKKWIFKSLRKAIGAIALHALQKINIDYFDKIIFNKNPFCYLLIFIDNIQDWERSIVADEKWPVYHLIKIATVNDSISLQYVISSYKWNGAMEKEVLKFLSEKETILNLLKGPLPKLNTNVVINLKSNERHIKREIPIDY
jgi:hypothetical protein